MDANEFEHTVQSTVRVGLGQFPIEEVRCAFYSALAVIEQQDGTLSLHDPCRANRSCVSMYYKQTGTDGGQQT